MQEQRGVRDALHRIHRSKNREYHQPECRWLDPGGMGIKKLRGRRGEEVALIAVMHKRHSICRWRLCKDAVDRPHLARGTQAPTDPWYKRIPKVSELTLASSQRCQAIVAPEHVTGIHGQVHTRAVGANCELGCACSEVGSLHSID